MSFRRLGAYIITHHSLCGVGIMKTKRHWLTTGEVYM